MVFVWQDGRQYNGQWKDGKQHGSGTSVSGVGEKMVGENK